MNIIKLPLKVQKAVQKMSTFGVKSILDYSVYLCFAFIYKLYAYFIGGSRSL
jgi:hypothetical protein